MIVPVGGGGLASGIGIALRRARPEVQLIGVQASACAPYVHALAHPDGVPLKEFSSAATIADGIALKRPGRLTLPLLRELLGGLETVSEDEIAEAMVFLADGAKLVAEGAGAVAVAALRSGRLAPVEGATVAIVSGGNVDGGLLAEPAAPPRNGGGTAGAPVHAGARPSGWTGRAAQPRRRRAREPAQPRARAGRDRRWACARPAWSSRSRRAGPSTLGR